MATLNCYKLVINFMCQGQKSSENYLQTVQGKVRERFPDVVMPEHCFITALMRDNSCAIHFTHLMNKYTIQWLLQRERVVLASPQSILKYFHYSPKVILYPLAVTSHFPQPFQTQATTNKICLFWPFNINGILPYVGFCD